MIILANLLSGGKRGSWHQPAKFVAGVCLSALYDKRTQGAAKGEKVVMSMQYCDEHAVI